MPGREPSIRRCRFIRAWAFTLAAIALPAAAEDLLQVYRDAQRYDAVYAAARFSLEAGRERIPQARALLLPTLDLVGTYGTTRDTGSLQSGIGREITTGQIALQLAVPLYQGGSLSSREREAAANYLKAGQDLENARRTAAVTTRQTYLAVINGIAQVGALEQALTSSQSALDSNRLGYEVGVRINIDVLNAQQQLFSTRRDLAVARYNAILNQLRLKAAAGTLREEDLEEVNRALQP